MCHDTARPGRAWVLLSRVSYTALLAGLFIALPPVVSRAGPPPAPPSANQIIPTGRTATTVKVSGAVTDITTTSVAGSNAFNDFSKFSTVAGTVVNLQVPGSANNLVNLVRNAPVFVGGILNSYQNGQIGGNVVFADPYGFIVGQSGTVNVGSLSVRTPTQAFMDQLISPGGQIDNTAAAALLAGDVPISPDGRVSIRGKVNAQNNVSLVAHSIAVGAGPAAIHAAEFAATVNTTGLTTGAAIVASNGGIDIVAAGDVAINGQVSTGAAPGRSAGPVNVKAGGNIQFGSNAQVTARGVGAISSGGAINVQGGRDLTVAAGALFDSSAGTTGNGGQIEISTAGKETLSGGIYNASAAGGIAGAVTFDPNEMEISGTNTTVGGTDFIDTAASITVDANAIIVTRQVASSANPADPTVASTGNSGNITLNLTANSTGSITIMPGAQLLAFATDAYAAGNITLNAGTLGTISFPTDPNLTAYAVLATRVIPSGTGASLTTSASSGNSGNITLTAGTIALGTGINTESTSSTAPGEAFLANAAVATCAAASFADCTTYNPGNITFNVGSFAFSPAAPVLTEGANLVVNATGTVSFPAGSLINTRHQAPEETDTSGYLTTTYFSPTDPTSSILDTPGNVTINAAALSYPAGINDSGGAAIYAGGSGGSYGFLPGMITFNVPSLTVSGTIGSAGAHLVLNATSGALTVAPGTVLDTREVAAGTDATDPTNASFNESGDLTLMTSAGNNVVIGAGAELLTFSTDAYYAGNINLLSGGSVVFTAPTNSQTPAELVAVTVSSTAAASGGFYSGSSANSGNVTMSAGTGGSVQLNGGLNSDNGPTVLAGAALSGTFAYLPGTITISAPSIAVAAGTPFDTLGANLDLTATTAITVAANAAINTRDVASGAAPATLANTSTGNSGNVKLSAPSITMGAGSLISASAVGTDLLNGVATATLPGTVTITAGTTLSLASGGGGGVEIDARGLASGATSVRSGTADAAGGTISLTAPSIALANGINTANGYVLLAAGGDGNAPGSIALSTNSFDLSSTILGLGANVSLTASAGNVTLENAAVIDTTATNDAAGNITLSGTQVVLPASAINQNGSVTLTATATGSSLPGTITLSQTDNLDYLTSSLTATASGAGFVLQTAGTLSLGPNLSINTQDPSSGAAAGPAGNIALVANNIVIGTGFNGTGAASLLAAGGNGYAPGTITLEWTGTTPVVLNSSASFNSAGANLAFLATSVSIEDSATINSGSNTTTIAGQTVQLTPTSVFDAGAVSLGETAASSDFVISSNLSFAGINLSIATDGSITVDQGVILSTRKTSDPFDATPAASNGNSGSITLAAPVITMLGTLDAGVTNASGSTWTAGDVALTATQTEQPVAEFGNTTATTAISIGNSNGVAAVINGANVTISSSATSDSEPFSTLETGYVTLTGSSLLQSLGQINGSVQLAIATSTTHVYGGTTISGTGDVVVQAVANTTASNTTPESNDFPSIGLTGESSGLTPSLPRAIGLPLNATFAVMEATATATALVDSGATINAGGTLTVRAHNIDLIHSDESVLSTNNTLDIAVAYSSATINATAIINNGANINAGAVRVIALNDNQWETSAEVSDMGQGKGGIVLALAENDTSNATALMNANLTLPVDLPSGVTTGLLVEAESDTTVDTVSASAESGSGDFSAKALGAIGGDDGGLASALNSKTGGTLSNVFSNNSSTQENQIRFAFGVALNLGNTQTATALIGGSTAAAIAAGYMPGTLTPPTVDSPGGNVAIVSSVIDSGVQTQALSTIRSTSFGEQSTSFPGTTYGFGGAVAITDITHTANAEIGTQAAVTAPAVGVDASIYVPLSLPITDWGTPAAIMNNILSFLPTILENSTAEVDTTGANAVANAQQLGVAGSVDLFTLNDNATAWVGQGASVTALNASDSPYLNAPWSVTLDTGNDAHAGVAQSGDSGDPTATWNSTVGITAADTVAAINIGGGIDLLGILHPAKSTSSTAGAAFSETNFTQTTIAGIGSEASVNTSGTLDVDATAIDYIITLVPSATNSGSLAISGMVGLSILDNTTDAAISDAAAITADLGLTLDAAQYINSSIVAGALFQKGSTVAFGIGIGINLPTTDTEAFIGDTSMIDPTGAPAAGFIAPTAGVTTASASVFALTSGQVLSLGLAGSLTSSSESSDHENEDEPTNSDASEGTGNISGNDTVNGIAGKLAFLDNVLPNWPSGPELPELPQFGLAVSGSAAVDQVALTTKAYLSGVTITDPSAGATDTLNVSAVRNLWLITGAGGFAASTSDSSQTNVDIAGTLALDISNNITNAYIQNSQVSGFANVQVAALEGGQQIDVGIDLAATFAEGGTAVGVAVSASIGIVNDGVGAWIDGSTITGQGNGVGATSVVAYDNTNIGLGGGAFTLNFGADGGGSAGVGVTFAEINDPSGTDATDAYINNSTVTQFGAVSVLGASAGRIIMGALSGSVSSQSTGVGAVTYAQIDTTTNAAITGNSTVTVTNSVTVEANGGDQSSYDSALSQYGTVSYSSIGNFSGGNVLGVLDSGSNNVAPTQIGTGGAAIIAIAGTISIITPGEDGSEGANANVGLQLTINDIDDTYSALIADSTITTAKIGSVNVEANDSATILGISAGAAVSTSSSSGFSLTGLASLTINLISDHATATVGDAGGSQYSTSISTGALTVLASNAAITDAFAGNIDVSTSDNSAAFGAAIAFALDTQTTAALLTNSKLNVDGQIAVQAATNPACTSNCPLLPYTIADAAFAIAASAGDAGIAGAITANVIENTTSATTTANSINDPAVWGVAAYPATDGTTLMVTGSDNSTIGTFAIAVAGASDVGVGAGISYGDIANTVSAAIDGDNGTDTNHPAIIVGGVLVQASSTPTIETLAAGVGGGEDGGVGGSIVTNFVGVTPSQSTVKTATASIDQGAIVSALGNVYVIALDNSGIEVIAGSLGVSAGGEPGVGIGVGLIVNDIQTASTAQVLNSTVDAAGQSLPNAAGGVTSVNNGTLSTASGNAPDVSQITAPTATTYALAEDQDAVQGLAVVATADEQVIANTVSIGLQISPEPGVGASVNVLVNLLGGTTTADITGSKIDTTFAAGTLPAGYVVPDVFVNASSNLFTGNFVVALAGSGYVAAAGAADASQIERTTNAYLSGGQIGSVAQGSQVVTNPYEQSCSGNNCSDNPNSLVTTTLTVTTLTPEPSIGTITVNAATTVDTADIVLVGSAGAAALAGGVAVDIFSPTTNAYVAAGTPVVANNLAVAATTENGNNMLGGAGSLGLSGGVGLSFGVLVSNDTTDAYIGDQANEMAGTTLTVTGSISVQAAMTDNFNSLVVSGAGGGEVGIAGMADVLVITNTTTSGMYLVTAGTTGPLASTVGAITNPSSGVYDQTITNEYGASPTLLPAPTSIETEATETLNIAANAGTLAVGIGAAGVGAGATVIVIKSNTTAVDYDDALNATSEVDVEATSTKSIQATALSLGAGGSVGIGASALLILVGTAPSGGLDNINTELNAGGTGTLSSVNSSSMGSTSGSTSDSTATPAAPSYSVSGTINNDATDAVTATIEGGTITTDTLSVLATSNISTSSIVGGAGLSLGLGAGGGVGYTLIYDTVTASAYGGTFDANAINILALAQDATPVLSKYPGTVNVLAIAGGAGLVGLGAAYANGTVDDTVTASIGGTVGINPALTLAANTCTNSDATCLTVSGSDTATINIGAYGAELGAAAVGVVVGQANKTSDVGASVLGSSVLSGFASTIVSANQSGALSATTVGAAGGLLAAGTGAASTATTLSQVTASTGTDVTLPNGDFSLIAMNNPSDTTSALGAALGGYFAAGVGVAESYAGGGPVLDTSQPIDPTQSIYTAATLGGGAVTSVGRTGAVNLTATSVSMVSAEGTAGAGGGVAGAAAEGITNDTALTTVTLNQPAGMLYAGTVTLSATHTTNFAGQSNSASASVVGGSGSQTSNTIDAQTTTMLANNTKIVANGAVSISAADDLVETLSGDAAFGAGGGVLEGAAALVDSTFTVDATVMLGTGVQITSGTDPILNPGAIAIGAGILVNVGDTSVLDTGGVLDGATAQNSLVLTANTNVQIGSNDNIYSQGALGVGSYVQVEQATPDANSNTYGLAAVGNANASATITANQTTEIGQGATINGLGSVWVTAGLDPSGSVPTIINAAPNAYAVAYGLVGVPVVNSSANLTSNTTFTVDSGALIESALNVTLGGYPGAPFANPSAYGSGDILGVPTTSGTASPTTATSDAVTMNGAAIAGEFNTLAITINPSQCLGDGTCLANETSGFPTTITYNPSEDLVDLVLENFPTNPAQGAALASVPTIDAPTVTLGTLYAAGGLIYMNAGTLTGDGHLTANGGPTITVDNPSNAFLVIGPILIPGQPGGSVIFTGPAGAQSDPSLLITQSAGNTGNILISSTGSGTTGGVAPGMIFTGTITATTGNITITNANGSIALAQSVIGLSATVDAPNGIDVIGSGTDPQYEAGNPFSEWDATILYPGGDPNNVTPNADQAIAYAANAIDPGGNTTNYSEFLYGVANSGSSKSGTGSQTDGYNYVSQVWFGNCGPASYGDCSSGTAAAISATIGGSGAYAIDPNGGPNYYYFASVPVERTLITVDTVPNTAAFTGASGGLVARQITIQGSYIAIAGQLVLGSPTQVSIDVPASDDALLALLHDYGGGATYTLTKDSVGNPLLTYNSGQNQLVLNNVSAASNASQILLYGKILGVNPDGQISVNTGLGAVTVTNESGVALTVNNINAGSTAANLTSTVQIIDLLSDTNNVYRYTTGSGLQHLETSNLSYYCQVGTDCTNGAPVVDTNTTTYSPQSGSRLTWTLQAELTRSVNTNGAYTDWSFTQVPLTTNPWQYIGSDGLTGTPTATLVTTGKSTDPAFSEMITAYEPSSYDVGVYYHGCSGDHCHYGFPSNSSQTDSKGGNGWLYVYPTSVVMDLNITVRADYAFGIDFGGSTTGSINVTTDSPLTVAGNLFNPNGTTTLTSTGSSALATSLGLTSPIPDGIYVATGAQIEANTLALNTTGPIGTITSPVPVTLTQASGNGPYGTLSASAGSSGVFLAVNSGATIGQVSSDSHGTYGDVVITSEFGLAATQGNVSIIGSDITLDVASGGVGSSAVPLNLQPNGTGGQSGGVVNISALGDIDIERQGGNLLAGAITSVGGDVSISIPDGTLLDAAAQTPLSILQPSQVAAIQTSLGISSSGESAGTVMANTVTPTQATVDNEYAAYWNLVNTLLPNGTVTGTLYASTSTFALDPTPQILAVFTPLAQQAENQTARAAGQTPTIVTTAQVQAFANGLYRNIVTIYAPFFAKLYGANWQTLPAFINEATAPTVFSSAQISALEVNPNLSAAGLLNSAISFNALQPAGAAVVGTGVPNVSGRTITVTEATNIGQLGTPIDIPFSSILNGTLTTPQAEALDLATTPGQATFIVQPSSGPAISIPITELSQDDSGQYFYTAPGHAPVAVTVTNVQIEEPAPLFLASSGELNLNTNGSVFVESTIPTLPIGTVIAGGTVSITAPQSLISALNAGQTNIKTTGGGIDLTAGTGSIGTSSLPLVVTVNGAPSIGGLTSVSAGQDVYISYVGNDLTVGSVFAGDLVSITAQHSILSATDALNITATTIDLQAQGSIGSSTAALQVQVGPTGDLTGSAVDAAYIFSPTETNQAPVTLIVSDFTAGTTMSLGASGSVDATGITATAGSMTVASGATTTVTDASSKGPMTLTSVGDMVVGGLTTTGSLGLIELTTGTTGAVTVTGGTSVDSGAGITAQSATFTMDAGATLLAAGPVSISTTGNAVLGSIEATVDGITVVADPPTGTASILSNGDSGAALTANGTGGAVSLTATNDIGAASLPISVSSPLLSASSTDGNIWIAGLVSLDATLLSAPQGAISLTDTGTLTAGVVDAGTTAMLTGSTGLSAGTVTTGGNATLTATAGNLALTGSLMSQGGAAFDAPQGSVTLAAVNADTFITATAGTTLSASSLTSGGAQTLTGGTGVSFGALDTTGTTGTIQVTATTGDITGSAPGSVTSDSDVVIDAMAGNVTVPTVSAATTATLTAAETLALGTVTSAGAQTLTGGTGVSFATLSTTRAGGTIQVTATTGDITGAAPGTVTSDGGVVIDAMAGNVTVPTVTAATTASLTAGELLTLGTVSTAGAQTLTGGTGVSFGTLSSSTEAGAINVTATTGDITGSGPGKVNSAGSVTLDAETGNATVPTVIAATTAALTAGDLLTLGTVTSAGAQTLTGGTGVTYGALNTSSATGNIQVTATTGAITGSDPGTVTSDGSVTLDAFDGGVTVPAVSAATTIALTASGTATIGSLSSGGSESLTAGTLALGSVTTTGIAGDPGNVSFTSTIGGITTGTLGIAGTTTMQSAAGISLPTLTSGSTILLQATGGIQFSAIEAASGTITLDAGGSVGSATSTLQGPGAIDVTAGGQILLASIASSGGSLTLSGAGGVTVPTVTAPDGNVTADSSGGTVDLTTTTLGLALQIDASQIVLGTTLSGGSQTLTSTGGISFTTLTADGIAADPGDITLLAGGTIGGATIDANGNVAVTSTAGTVTLPLVTSATGSVDVAGGSDVTLTTVTAPAQLTAASGGKLVIGTATTGGTQMLAGTGDVDFTLLTTSGTPTDPGDVDITSISGAISGGDINAHGSVTLNGNGVGFGSINAGGNGAIDSTGGIFGQTVDVGGNLSMSAGTGGNGDLSVATITGSNLNLSAAGSITLTTLTVTNSLTMAASEITGSIIQSSAATAPLVLTLTGHDGGLANDITLAINAPNGIDIPLLRAVDASFVTNANDVLIESAYVTGILSLDTPDPLVVVDNIDTTPLPGVNVQLYQPSFQFFLDQIGRTTLTNAYFVIFQQPYEVIEAAFTNGHIDASPLFIDTGISRDASWNTTAPLLDDQQVVQGDDDYAFDAWQRSLRSGLANVSVKGRGPAVNLRNAADGMP